MRGSQGVVERNPIEQRLDRLHRQWDAFARAREARILRWVFAPDEWRMFEALLALEHRVTGELPVLFVVLAAPFEAAPRHGHELRRELAEYAGAGAPEFEALGLAAWRSPIFEGTSSDIGMFSESLASLHHHLADRLEQLAIVLWPSAVLDANAYVGWLRRLARVVPERVKIVVPDRSEAPRLAGLEGERIMAIDAALDMAGAAEALAAAAPGGDEPGGRFRAAFVAMSAAFGRGQLAVARERAEVARAIAEATPGFAHLEVSLAFAYASGLLGLAEHADAIAEFVRAEQRAAVAESAGEGWAGAMRLRAAVGVGAALVGAAWIGAAAWPEAATRWLAAADLARALDEAITELDCLRMAAWSHERGGRLDDAWALARVGLDRAAELDPALRAHATLPWLGELLLRLCESGPRANERARVTRSLAELLGPNWRTSKPG